MQRNIETIEKRLKELEKLNKKPDLDSLAKGAELKAELENLLVELEEMTSDLSIKVSEAGIAFDNAHLDVG